MVEFGNLKLNYLRLKKEIDKATKEVFESGWFVLGKQVEEFEKEFSDYCGKKFGVGVGSGFDALNLALKALNIGKGDEVITIPNTAIPTVAAICASGATPRFVDVKEDYLIDVEKIEQTITEKTKAIMPVHLYGRVCDMEKILEIAEKYNLKVIEDCAQTHGAEFKGKKVPIGEIGCFSFYPSKNLGAYGDGGMIVCEDEKLKEKLKFLRNYGQVDKHRVFFHGINSRLDELQAAILRKKLGRLEEDNEKRGKIAEKYNLNLKGVKVPVENPLTKSVYHLYVIRSENRDELMKHLKEQGIGCAIHYLIPLHLQEAYKFLGYKEGDFPVAEKISKEILSLPIYPELKEGDIERVCGAVNDFVF